MTRLVAAPKQNKTPAAVRASPAKDTGKQRDVHGEFELDRQLADPAPAATRSRVAFNFAHMQVIAPVQRLAAPGAPARKASGSEGVRAAAQLGIGGTSQPLPHRARIQQSFGRHDVSAAKAHMDVAAQSCARGIGGMRMSSTRRPSLSRLSRDDRAKRCWMLTRIPLGHRPLRA